MRFVVRRAASRGIIMIILVSARRNSGSPWERRRQGNLGGASHGEPAGLVPVLRVHWRCGHGHGGDHFGGQPPAVPADRAQPFCHALLGDLRRAARVPRVRQRRPLSGLRSSVGLWGTASVRAASIRCRTAADDRLALGALEEAKFRSGLVSLRPGDLIAIFTDGVTEAFDAAGSEFGEASFETSSGATPTSGPRRCVALFSRRWIGSGAALRSRTTRLC